MAIVKQIALSVALASALVSVTPVRAEQQYPADDSGRNVRDQDSNRVTPQDQSNDKTDVRITQQIRKAVVADKELSMSAHNVKIITRKGVVTLRGPVVSAAERSTIEAKASRVTGVTHVDNQLEIAKR
ncbi:MAG TPA: BON domain-containing protein [Candidatus Binatia bacterium]|jgi:osmotically-inducible protein OsmY